MVEAGDQVRGVSLDTLMADVTTSAEYAVARAVGDYTTDLPLEDLLDGKAWIAFRYDDADLEPSTAARPGCWCRTCTCGSPRSGSAVSSCSTTTSPASGKPSATTTTETHGASSGTGAGQLAAVREETATARTLVLEVPGWAGHLPGQHVDVRLTAEDGYSTERSYSIASAPGATRLELTIQRLDNGEVSPYLTEILAPGNRSSSAARSAATSPGTPATRSPSC